MRAIVIILAAASAVFLAAAAAAAPVPLKVAPTENRSGDKRFDDLLVIQGITNLVAQELYDTGLFVPIEEKAEIGARIRELGGKRTGKEALAEAVAAVTKVRVSRLRGVLGLFGGARTTVRTTVEVGVRIRGRPEIRATGTAKAVTKAAGAFFEVRNDKIAFDATSTGRMVQEAVHRAVQEIAAKLREKP